MSGWQRKSHRCFSARSLIPKLILINESLWTGNQPDVCVLLWPRCGECYIRLNCDYADLLIGPDLSLECGGPEQQGPYSVTAQTIVQERRPALSAATARAFSSRRNCLL